MFRPILIALFAWSGFATAATEVMVCTGESRGQTYAFLSMFDLATKSVRHFVVSARTSGTDKDHVYKILDGDSVRLILGEGEFGGFRMYYGAYLNDERPYLSLNTNDNGRTVIQWRGKGQFAFNPTREGPVTPVKCVRDSLDAKLTKEYSQCFENFGACAETMFGLKAWALTK